MFRKILHNIKTGMIWDVNLSTYPFVYAYVGVFIISLDRSHKYYDRWPHISISLDID